MTQTDPTKENAMRDLRRWHLGAGTGSPLPPDVLPALLAPFRDPSRVRHDYPLVLEHAASGLIARPLGELLPEWTQRAVAQPRVLHDNLPRLERRARLALREKPSGDARQLLRDAGEQMIAEMQLRDGIAAGVRDDLGAMLDALPEIELLPLHGSTALQLLLAAARQRVTTARSQFGERVKMLSDRLRQLLDVEAQKSPAAHRAGAMKKSLGGAATQFLDPKALAQSVGKHRGSVPADPDRLQRLQQALATFDEYLAADPMPELVLVHGGEAPTLDGASVQHSDDACADAVTRFDRFAATLLPVARATYLAELEHRGVYEAARHDPMLAALGMQDLSREELHALPVIAALVPARSVAGHEMQSLARLLTSGRPVQVVIHETPSREPFDDGAERDAALPARSRLELGYLGIAFRDAYVQQTTAARPAHLLRGLECALRGTRPALHVIDSGLGPEGEEPPLGAFLHAGAAIEGRAHPLFQYDPEAGETWAKRLDFTLNPSPEADWPRSEVNAELAGTDATRRELSFTFADYALLETHLHGAFSLLPETIDGDEVLELADYLELDAEEARRRIPFVWIITGDADAAPQRAAVRRSLVDACRDRLRFWRTLQELAGVRNDYVREAVQRARQEAAEEAAREREALEARHQQDLGEVRGQATDAAMQGLARMLLELDPMGEAPAMLPRVTAEPPAPDAPAEEPAAPAEEPAATAAAIEVEEEDEGYDEAWIESPRCSTCNDCININSLLFVYDENKQARIGDPKAGTFAQLVQAAEKCPSRCIHPGKPLNPDEPDLEALVARAAPFN